MYTVYVHSHPVVGSTETLIQFNSIQRINSLSVKPKSSSAACIMNIKYHIKNIIMLNSVYQVITSTGCSQQLYEPVLCNHCMRNMYKKSTFICTVHVITVCHIM